MPGVLVTGASVAGPALAYWLGRGGWEVTVVERFDRLRDTGQNIDIRGAGREVIRRMGLEDEVKAAGTGETGTEFVDEDGRCVAYLPKGHDDSGGLTAEVEILRGDLARLLYRRTAHCSRYVFGDEITGLVERSKEVDVHFAGGARESFDLVVVAEGMTSRTRRLIFPDAAPRYLGLCLAYTTVPRIAADTDRWRWYHPGGGRAVMLRPDPHGTMRAALSFLSGAPGPADLPPADQARLLRRLFQDAGWETPRVLDAIDASPFYFEAVGQIRLASWSRGRVALVGDAAYCASPLSGMGTTLALTGAYILAGELLTAADHRTAFARYEALMRPYAHNAQRLVPGFPRIAHPRSRLGVRTLRAALRLATSPPVREAVHRASALFPRHPAERIDLPHYPEPR
ncbi:FAD-dependent monooxygenase [Nonomuraea aridisoli]|uniref:FAD-binding monooxygenase n=1 Tax=Nonomuraea aridisoli TaxID=2070368 RepID=A0A2W2DPK4_9ACTN|nr:FAD-dependent monooxygenase [Nonomuraea aridisoli]PZG12573.1 FAD-binding monooxygenase [Nonomuraea aridisoli]